MIYVRNLDFDKKPDYKYMRNLFDQTAESMNLDLNDFEFEWAERKEQIIKDKLAREKAEREMQEAEALKNGKEKTYNT